MLRRNRPLARNIAWTFELDSVLIGGARALG